MAVRMTIESEMRAIMAATEAANASAAQRGADMPLRPKTHQRLSCEDLPLFGDTHKQLDLIDAIRKVKP